MTVAPLFDPPAFRNVAEALAWSDRRGLSQRYWRLVGAPPVDATGKEDIDAHLAATFGILASFARTPDPLRDRLMHLQVNAQLVTSWGRNAEAARQFDAAVLHFRAAEIVNRWATEIGAAACRSGGAA